MNIKKVEVEFLFEGVVNPSENMQGVLFGDKVLVCDNECGPGLYTAVMTDNAGKVIIDLDADATDHLEGKADLLIDFLTA